MYTAALWQLLTYVIALGAAYAVVRQCRKPRWLLGRLILARMNRGHAALTQWGLSHLHIGTDAVVLDIGCGGGRTIGTLTAMAPRGTIHGVDYSPASVAVALRHNARSVAEGRVDIQEASVSNLPFAPSTFDTITAIETHYYWPNLPADLREVRRVLKPGGTLMILAETYKGRTFDWLFAPVMTGLLGATYLTLDQHRALLSDAGFVGVDVTSDRQKGWVCAVGQAPS